MEFNYDLLGIHLIVIDIIEAVFGIYLNVIDYIEI
jgi:hypothetical protein